MDFNFILDENYLAYFILNSAMHNESVDLKNIKSSLINDIGYKKILRKEILDSSIYIINDECKMLINELIKSDVFLNIYKNFSNESKEILAIKLLKNYIKIEDDKVIDLQNELWNKYNDAYNYILTIDFYNPTTILKDKDVINTINEFKNSESFKKMFDETNEYYDFVIDSWNNNKDNINNYLNNVLRYNFNIKPNVYISHPDAHTGYSFGDNVAWGHYKGIDNINYNLVYLVHEGLHNLLPFEKNETEDENHIKHSIIEMISDYELYSTLENKSTLNQGHDYLENYKIIIYPYWLKYIGLSDADINNRLIRDNMVIDDIPNIDFSDMNIKDFINFCNGLLKEKNKIR